MGYGMNPSLADTGDCASARCTAGPVPDKASNARLHAALRCRYLSYSNQLPIPRV